MARNGWALPAPDAAGTLAKRLYMDTELRELARQLLAMEPGDVARSGLSFTGLGAAVDYLGSAVQAAHDRAAR